MTERISKYKEGDKTFVFMTWGSCDKRKKIRAKDIIFLAKVTIKNSDWECYYIHIDKVILQISPNLFKKDQVSRFAHLWVDRGEEAFDIWHNPSHR